MPFLKRGMRIQRIDTGQFGVITKANRQGNLNIRLDGERFSRNFHPQWMLRYFDSDNRVIAEYKD